MLSQRSTAIAVWQQHFTAADAIDSFAHMNVLLTHPEWHPAHTIQFWDCEETVILGMQDMKLPNRAAALRDLSSQGYHYFVRNSGGLAIVSDTGVLNISLFLSHDQDKTIRDAYRLMVAWFRAAFKELSIDTGEITHSYCPGEFDLSVNGQKFAGMAQRRRQTGIVVMLYCSVDHSQLARTQLLKRFYARGQAETQTHFDFPQIRDSSMTTLSALLHRPLAISDVITRLLNVLPADQQHDHTLLPHLANTQSYQQALVAARLDMDRRMSLIDHPHL